MPARDECEHEHLTSWSETGSKEFWSSSSNSSSLTVPGCYARCDSWLSGWTLRPTGSSHGWRKSRRSQVSSKFDSARSSSGIRKADAQGPGNAPNVARIQRRHPFVPTSHSQLVYSICRSAFACQPESTDRCWSVAADEQCWKDHAEGPK